MKKNRVLIVVLSLLFSSGSFLNASSAKIERIFFEISPETHLLFFDNDLVGRDYFHSTQMRISAGVGVKKRSLRYLVGLEFLTPMRVFDDNIGASFDFYRFGVLVSLYFQSNNKLTYSFGFVLGGYRFSVDDNPLTCSFGSLRFGLGYRLFKQITLFGEVGLTLRDGYNKDSNYEVNNYEYEDFKMNILNLSFGVRFFLF